MARPTAENVVTLYNEAKSIRNPDEADYRAAAAYCLPQEYASWSTEGKAPETNSTNLRKTVFDSTGTRALPKYQAVLERLSVPIGSKWMQLTADPYLMKNYRVKVFMNDLTDLLFKYRYMPRAGFRVASTHMFGQLGCYGTGPIFVGRRKPNALSRQKSMIYRPIKFRNLFLMVNDNGEVDTAFLRFFLNARQFRTKWPNLPPPPSVNMEVMKAAPSEAKMFEFIMCVHPRDELNYDPSALDARRFPFVSSYICVDDKMYVGDEEGYKSFPFPTTRIAPQAERPYGFGPAMQTLANLGGASQMKKTQLKQGNMAGDPVILAHDDGILNGQFDMRPGRVNYGAINKEGKRLIDILPTGNFQINEALLEAEQNAINDAFFVTLFQMLEEEKEMSATEVVERISQRSALVSPTMGVLQTEWIEPQTEREIDVLDEMGAMLPYPPELIEARGEYSINYTSPLAKGMYAEEISGFMRSVQFSIQYSEATGDPSVMDNYDMDTAAPEIADRMAVPPRWINSDDKKAAIRDARDKAAAAKTATENAAGLAAAAQTAVNIRQPGVIPAG